MSQYCFSLGFLSQNSLWKLFTFRGYKEIPKEYNVHFGPIVSGDAFIYRKSQVNTILKYYPGTRCGEMEGSSIGRVCSNFNVPFNVIRSISDATLVQGDYKNFDFNLAQACKNAAAITEALIRS